MRLIDKAKEDWQRYTSNTNEFGVAITLTSLQNDILELVGLATKHHIGIDTDGNLVNTKNAHVSFSEKFLTDVSYPVRDVSGEVNLKGHKVTYSDSTGNPRTYVIREWFPDETVGMITCILGDYITETNVFDITFNDTFN